MNFELGKEYIVRVTEKGIIPICEFDITKYFGDGRHYGLHSCRDCKFRNYCTSRKNVEKCSTPHCQMYELEDL